MDPERLGTLNEVLNTVEMQDTLHIECWIITLGL